MIDEYNYTNSLLDLIHFPPQQRTWCKKYVIAFIINYNMRCNRNQLPHGGYQAFTVFVEMDSSINVIMVVHWERVKSSLCYFRFQVRAIR